MNVYALMIGLGGTLGLTWAVWRAPLKQARAILDAGLVTMVLALIGARLAYVLVNWEYYQVHLPEMLAFWHGGLAWPGALLGGLTGLAAGSLAVNVPIGVLADGLMPLVPPLVVAAWLGCWQAGCAYGAPLESTAWALPARDEYGVMASRWPLQVIEAAITTLLFVFLDLLRSRLHHPGQAASFGWLGLSLLLLAAALFRADPMPAWRGYHLDAWAALISLGLSMLACLYTTLRRPLEMTSATG